MRKSKIKSSIKVIVLTILTFGVYGAYWIMNSLYKEEDISADEAAKDADYTRRTAAAAFLMRHGWY